MTTSGVKNGVTTNYVQQVAYWPQGDVYYWVYGNNVWPVMTYTKTLQPLYSYSTLGNSPNEWLVSLGNSYFNNGNVSGGYECYGPAPGGSASLTCLSQFYRYDSLNRLASASEQYSQNQTGAGFSRTFVHDPFGNMSVSSAPSSGLTPQTSNNPFNLATNQLIAGQYNARGDLNVYGAVSMAYNGENQIFQIADSGTNQTATFAYDALGQRVQRTISNGATTVWAYDAFGKMAAEYNSVGVAPSCEPCYLSYDSVGSVRLVTNESGNIVARHDYMPYGEEIYAGQYGRPSGFGFGASTNVQQLFTGQTRDGGTATQDFFNAREFMAVAGRFNSPDPMNAGADPRYPQSWNGYAYALGNPLQNVDQSGMDCITLDNGATADDGTGKPCAGSSDPSVTNVNGGGGPPIFSWAWFIDTLLSFQPGSTPITQRKGGTKGSPTRTDTPNYCAYQGAAQAPQQYAALGKNFSSGIGILGQSYGLDVALSFGAGSLYGQFSKGSALDAQPKASGTGLQRAAYGNYVYGAFFAGAGVSLSETLAAANAYAYKQQVTGGAYAGRVMDTTYTHLPLVNVQDITSGYNAATSGTLCHH